MEESQSMQEELLAAVQEASANIVYEVAELYYLRKSVFFHKPSVKNFLSDKWMIPFSLRCVRYGVALITYFG